jgi:hypothetical protein
VPLVLADCIKTSALRGVVFTQEYPDSPVKIPTIVWRVYHRTPGNEGKEKYGPRARGGQHNINHSTVVHYWAQWNTVIYQFDLFHATNAAVDELMEKFELFAKEVSSALKNIGIEYFGFYEQLQDYTLPTPKEVPSRSLRYLATFSVTLPLYIPRIRQIDRFVAVNTLGKSFEENSLSLVRGDEDVDNINLPLAAITMIADQPLPPAPDYIAGIDYELTVAENGHSTDITWTLAGKRPAAGSTYYVMYGDVDAFTYTTIT